MTSQGKVKLQVWGLIVIVFALGGVTGAALDRLYAHRNAGESSAAAEGGRRPGRHHEEMRRELSLNDEQVKAVRNIFEEARNESRKYFDQCPGFKEQRERTQARIRELLTPEQQRRYDEQHARREAERKKREGR